MRYYLISILAILTHSICTSQDDYIPFVQENKYWFYATNDGSEPAPRVIHAYVLYFQGDTVISNKLYVKVIQSALAGSHPCQFPPCFTANQPYEFLDSRVIGYITEDTIQKSVKYLPENLSAENCEASEMEIYNFNVEQGDSIPACMLHHIRKVSEQFVFSDDWGDIESVSTNFVYQKDRKTLSFEAPYVFSGMPFISVVNIFEGIGMEYYDPFQYTDNTVLYHFCEGSLSDCNILSTAAIDPIKNNNTINISPNPALHLIRIDSPISFESIEIFDQRGKVMQFTKQIEMDVSNYPSGIYILRLISNDNRCYFSKFVKL